MVGIKLVVGTRTGEGGWGQLGGMQGGQGMRQW